MENKTQLDVIIIGGSYSGLAAAMALGRAKRKVLVIDSGEPCNRQTPYSHNFLTRDGNTPAEIAAIGKQQVEKYPGVSFYNAKVTEGRQMAEGFEIETDNGRRFQAARLIFATGIRDILPDIQGIAECWGISALHCPFCHGFEISGEQTGILGNGDSGYELSQLISNWSENLSLYTNGPSMLTSEQTESLKDHQINIIEKNIEKAIHDKGYIDHLVFTDGSVRQLKAVYSRNAFEQHCPVAQALGCEMTPDGYIKVDAGMETSIKGILACGDNTGRNRTVANAVATGTTAGMTASRKMIIEEF